MKVLPVAIVLAAMTGCSSLHQPTIGGHKIEGDEDMKATLLREIPAGTDIGQARRFMEKEGFSCSMCFNSSFLQTGEKESMHTGIDYLLCERADDAYGLVSETWKVAVLTRNDAVADVLVKSWLTGP